MKEFEAENGNIAVAMLSIFNAEIQIDLPKLFGDYEFNRYTGAGGGGLEDRKPAQ